MGITCVEPIRIARRHTRQSRHTRRGESQGMFGLLLPAYQQTAKPMDPRLSRRNRPACAYAARFVRDHPVRLTATVHVHRKATCTHGVPHIIIIIVFAQEHPLRSLPLRQRSLRNSTCNRRTYSLQSAACRLTMCRTDGNAMPLSRRRPLDTCSPTVGRSGLFFQPRHGYRLVHPHSSRLTHLLSSCGDAACADDRGRPTRTIDASWLAGAGGGIMIVIVSLPACRRSRVHRCGSEDGKREYNDHRTMLTMITPAIFSAIKPRMNGAPSTIKRRMSSIRLIVLSTSEVRLKQRLQTLITVRNREERPDRLDGSLAFVATSH